MDRIVLLHLSDLHFGQHSRFPLAEAEGVGDLLAEAVPQELKKLGWGARVDLVVVTGDLAERGLPQEFEAGGKFLGRVGERLEVARKRFAFVPGNHDISWTACRRAEAELHEKAEEEGRDVAEKELRAALDAAKLERYDKLVAEFYGTPLTSVARPLGRGAFLYFYEELRVSVGALNSCEKESHRNGDHVGHVSREQAQSLLDAWRAGAAAEWLKVLAVHHNPVVTTPNNVDWWQDELAKKEKLTPEFLARYRADLLGLEGAEQVKAIVQDAQVQLVLHGHHHAQDIQAWPWRKGGDARILSCGSLTLKTDNLPGLEPPTFRLIALDVRKKKLLARTLMYEPRLRADGRVEKGTFAPDSAENGVLDWPMSLPAGFGKVSTTQITSKGNKNKKPAGLVINKPREVFISYAWGDKTPAGKARAEAVDGLCEALEKDGFLPLRDRDQIRYGDRISAFIHHLTRADLVVAVISDKYLRSPYCMYEIYRLWQRCQGNADDLIQLLVPIVLPEVKVGDPLERAVYWKFWADRANSLEALIHIQDFLPSTKTWEEVRLVWEFAHHVDDILVFLNDILMPRKLEVQLEDDFQAVREALRRRMGVI